MSKRSIAKTNRVFFSFQYSNDALRTLQLRKCKSLEGNKSVTEREWNVIKERGDTAIKQWIDRQLQDRLCTIVLVGEESSLRKWIRYEIEHSWKLGIAVAGIYVHGLKDEFGRTSNKGANPFYHIKLNEKRLSSLVHCYSPVGFESNQKMNWLLDSLPTIIDEAIQIRARFS